MLTVRENEQILCSQDEPGRVISVASPVDDEHFNNNGDSFIVADDEEINSRKATMEDRISGNRNDMSRTDLNFKVLVFEIINPEAVRQVKDVNIIFLEPCPFLEDSLQYHDELLLKGQTSAVYKALHDVIKVTGCED